MSTLAALVNDSHTLAAIPLHAETSYELSGNTVMPIICIHVVSSASFYVSVAAYD